MGWKARRTAQGIVTVFAVLTISFGLIRLMPGNAVDYMIGILQDERGLPADRARERAERMTGIDPDKPIHQAYFDYMVNTLQGDLGTSVLHRDPVTEILAEAIPWTIFVASWALFIGFSIGIVLGALMAYYEGGKLDVGLTTYAMIMGSIPFYVFAIILLVVFAYRIQLFPDSGRYGALVDPGWNLEFIRSVIYHAILPVTSQLVTGSIASLSMRSNSIKELGADYVRVARLRGLSDSVIAVQYVARNAVLPLYTGLLIAIGAMIGGSVILEDIFSYRGVGWYMLQAVEARDMPLMMGSFLVITIAVVIALLIADLTYGYVDPRAGNEDREAF